MNSMNNLIDSFAAVSAETAKYLPEPAATGVGIFKDVMKAVRGFGQDVIGGIDVGGVESVATGDFAELIQLQLEAQREMQTTTMISNIEKSKHESKMSAIRNIRVN